VKAALSAMMVKTDRRDALGLAQLIRLGWFRSVHAKSIGSQEVRALLVARKQLLGRLIDVELSISRDPARLWPEGRPRDTQGFRGADSRIGHRSAHVGAYRRGNAFGAGKFESGIRRAAQGCTGAAPGRGLVVVLPLDRTAHRRHLLLRSAAGFGHLLHRFEKVAVGIRN
jgi:hypothetical protein